MEDIWLGKYDVELMEHIGEFAVAADVARNFWSVGQNEKDQWWEGKTVSVDFRYSAATECGFRYLLA
jgi:hypothetical protein